MRGVRGAPLSGVFLTAEWRDLLIVDFAVDPARLRPYLPSGTELDLFEGRCLVSLVGFRFLRTRVRGVAIPGHRDFDEMNLRFYVTRRTPDGSVRRGVTFLGEIVPRRAIAWVARGVYGEPYRAFPMRHRLGERATYEVRHGGEWRGVSGRPHGEWRPATADPATAFITEHYWGYTRRSADRTDEYEVRHPVWRVREVAELSVSLDVRTAYGAAAAGLIQGPPCSATFAEGSSVSVHRGSRM